jgi:hypothetical protein
MPGLGSDLSYRILNASRCKHRVDDTKIYSRETQQKILDRHYRNSLDLGAANDKDRYVTRNESA